ncbi:16S rRNA (cytosine(1402)-N(4))-methyltransferase RsmH [Marinilabiliaceae bacterium ANBcel2]|nr:16S rRNA (cytosine(1402)-N(4))-methyltransferase RsmH [Marinilabiliaceae bacterium ANBcel2]
MSNSYHIPVLLDRSIEGLNIKPDGVYTDLTFGGGGHSRAILEKLGDKGKLIVFDQDEDAYKNRIDDERVVFIRHNFRYMYNFLQYLRALPLDGIIADLGVSSYHFDQAERGFSFRFDADLDMRMSRRMQLNAADILNNYDKDDLIKVFKMYGEIKPAGRLVNSIVERRRERSFKTTTDLKEVAERFAHPKNQSGFLSKVFQSLRIEVNGEMDSLRDMLLSSLHVLKEGGRLVVISYHSLEDRMVKNFIRSGDFLKSTVDKDFYGNPVTPFKVISRKVIVPDREEVELNPRARSARLRIAEKL